MSSFIKYGIIGAGTMGQEHIKNVNLLDNAKVTSICDPNEGSLNQSSSLITNDFNSYKNLDELINKIDGLNVINNQLIIDKNTEVDLEVYQNIIDQISSDLSVNYVDVNKFDRESVKKLFMSEYLYRVDKNIIIGKEHISKLVDILKKLPDVFDVSEFKEESNLSRKFAIPYLEFLDKYLYTSKIDSSGKRKKLI